MRLIYVILFCPFLASAAPWFHIELGGGNYGEEGHTQTSQSKTVLKKLDVTCAPNYIDELNLIDDYCYVPDYQYRVLFDTLDELIQRHGPNGVFHINDLVPEYAFFAVERLREYAQEKGYTQIIVEAVPGDYANIDPRQTLSRYGADLYNTAHLKNPEVSFFHHSMDGDALHHSSSSIYEARACLQKLADLAHEGLQFTVILNPNFVPYEEVLAMFQQGFYEASTAKAYPYIWPEGDKSINPMFMHVVRIPNRSNGAT